MSRMSFELLAHRRRRAPRPPDLPARHRRNAGVHAGRHLRLGQGDDCPSDIARARRRDHPRQHLPPVPAPGPRGDRRRTAACTASRAGTARSSPTPAASRCSRSRTGARSPRRASPSPRRSTAARCSSVPEESMHIQRVLDSDIVMIFDECTPYPATEDVARDVDGADRCAGPSAAGARTRATTRRCSASCRAACIRACARARPKGCRRSASTATRSAASPSASRRPSATHMLEHTVPAAAGRPAALPDGRRPAGGPGRGGARAASTCSIA